MLKSIHLKALVVWGIYSVVTKGALLVGIAKSGPAFVVYLLNIFFSVFFGIIFLYFFSHEDFFKFAREIEKENSKKERIWVRRFMHYGKLFSSLIIGILAGPLIGALAVRFLLPKYQFKYLVVSLSSALSATIWLGIARGLIPVRLPF